MVQPLETSKHEDDRVIWSLSETRRMAGSVKCEGKLNNIILCIPWYREQLVGLYSRLLSGSHGRFACAGVANKKKVADRNRRGL